MKDGVNNQYSDVEFVEGLINRDPGIEKNFYVHCKNYFDEHYKAVFFSNETDREDIFQNTFITVWQNIERGKIRVENGVLTGRNDNQLKCTLTTYFMSVARNKYLELARSSISGECLTNISDVDKSNNNLVDDWLEDDYENAMFEVISDSISVMPSHCSKLLTKFYYENKKLDDMLTEIPGYKSKDALKSNKNRCLNRLKTYAKQLYKIRKNK